jgi:hypothetical protein
MRHIGCSSRRWNLQRRHPHCLSVGLSTERSVQRQTSRHIVSHTYNLTKHGTVPTMCLFCANTHEHQASATAQTPFLNSPSTDARTVWSRSVSNIQPHSNTLIPPKLSQNRDHPTTVAHAVHFRERERSFMNKAARSEYGHIHTDKNWANTLFCATTFH